jgi:cytochrome oxidase assembly protein ShyY1
VLTLLTPRYWGGHLLMLLCLAIAIGLGIWQYDAWSTRRAAEARDISNAAPVQLSEVMGGDDPFPGAQLGRPVAFTGRWLTADPLYVADRWLDGRKGYWVVTPVLVDGTRSAMPVVRGWTAEPRSAPVSGTAQVTGWLQPSEGSGQPDADVHDDVIPEMRTASIVEHVQGDLYGGFVVTRDTEEPGLAQVSAASIPEVSSTTALRNLLYAIEWWVFGGFAVFIWWRWCRDSLVLVDEQPIASEG